MKPCETCGTMTNERYCCPGCKRVGQAPRRLFISFSGGETSAFMAQWLVANWRDRYDEIKIVFANTGQEHDQTLEFVQRCDQYFKWGVVWVEAVVHASKGVGTTHRVVDFDTASRNGEPFEAVTAKYGIANQKYPHCSRELKLSPMGSYMRSVGWDAGSYDTAIGFRADEIDRMISKAKELRIVYPLISACPMTKPDVNQFWREMPFRLELKGYQGNCKWCWKKSTRKLLTLLTEDASRFDFPERMEKYAMVGQKEGYGPRRFFRGQKTVADLRTLAKEPFESASDDAIEFNDDLDKQGGCSESCEVFHDE